MHDKASLILGALMMVCSGCAVYIATGWPWKAALFPIAIGVPVFCLAAAEVAWGLFGSRDAERATDFHLTTDVPAPLAARRTLIVVGWLVGFFGAIGLIGFPLAVPAFVFLYLKLQGREQTGVALAFAAAVWAFFYGLFDKLLHIPFPAGWIQSVLGLA